MAWNPLGFPLIVVLLKGAPWTPSTIVIISLQHWLNSSQRTTGEDSLFMLTMQGLTLLKMLNFCEENELRFTPHPPYSPAHLLTCSPAHLLTCSPDLAPSDFFLFSYVKERLKGMVFPSYEESLDTRRNWWSGDRHQVGDFDCRVWALNGETEIDI
jgi:hypothetical protein